MRLAVILVRDMLALHFKGSVLREDPLSLSAESAITRDGNPLSNAEAHSGDFMSRMFKASVDIY
jgi:hypothetical protein